MYVWAHERGTNHLETKFFMKLKKFLLSIPVVQGTEVCPRAARIWQLQGTASFRKRQGMEGLSSSEKVEAEEACLLWIPSSEWHHVRT